MITKEMTLADVVKEYPSTIPYLNEYRLDYCCGGHDPIAQIAKEKNIELEPFMQELERLAALPKKNDLDYEGELQRFRSLSVPEMLADLERSHHVKERELMADVEALLNKILVVHYEHHGEELSSIHHHFALLKADLEEHFAKEEKLVFPIMKKSGKPSSEDIAYVKSLEEEHSTAGELIKLLQKETNFFTAPEDVCPTYRRCFSQMEALVEDIFMHIFKENSIAFPEYYEQK